MATIRQSGKEASAMNKVYRDDDHEPYFTFTYDIMFLGSGVILKNKTKIVHSNWYDQAKEMLEAAVQNEYPNDLTKVIVKTYQEHGV